eukprot:11028902-Alexandrium_andersonii.AAC.1
MDIHIATGVISVARSIYCKRPPLLSARTPLQPGPSTERWWQPFHGARRPQTGGGEAGFSLH